MILSGGSRIFETGVQVQADYGNSTDCFIMAGEYVYAEAAKLVPTVRMKHGKISEFRTFEIASAGFSGPIQRAYGLAVVETAASVPPPLWG